MRLRPLIAVVVTLVVAGFVHAEEKGSPQWQAMLEKSFDVDAKEMRVSGLVVDRNVGCVFISLEDKGVFCSSHGANRFSPNKKSWDQISKIRSNDLQHKFILTNSGIKESRDGGEIWSRPIPPPKGFVITEKTWLEYDAKHDSLYLMKPGSDLYKLARGEMTIDKS